MANESFPVVVIGAGPAGLATSRELRERGVEHVVLERGESIAHSWVNLYESLTLHTGKHMSALPGMRLPRTAPLFVPLAQFVAYLRGYAERFELPVRTGWNVTSVEHLTSDGGGWRVAAETARGPAEIVCDRLVVATGIIANPRVPTIPGADEFERGGGQLLHSVRYRTPNAFDGKRILVVGVGNSGGEIASELARSSNVTSVTIAVRSGANVVPREILGIPVQYLARYIRKLPRKAREAVVRAVGRVVEKRRGPPVLPRPAYGPLDAIPLIGFHLVDAIRAGSVQVRGAIERLTSTGALFRDAPFRDGAPAEQPFDVVILATGFAPALAPLGQLIRVDKKGFALRRDRVESADQDGLYFVGHNYDATGGLFNIARDSHLVAERIVGEARVERERSASDAK